MTSDRATARRGLLIFLPLVAVLDVLFVSVIVTTGNPLWIYALIWSVAATSVLCRLVLREGFGDVSFRFGGRRSLAFVAAGLVFPVAVGFVAFGTGWATGLATFTAPPGGFLAGLLLAASPARSTAATMCGALRTPDVDESDENDA